MWVKNCQTKLKLITNFKGRLDMSAYFLIFRLKLLPTKCKVFVELSLSIICMIKKKKRKHLVLYECLCL